MDGGSIGGRVRGERLASAAAGMATKLKLLFCCRKAFAFRESTGH